MQLPQRILASPYEAYPKTLSPASSLRMDAIEQAGELLDLDPKWLQEFDVSDLFSGLAMTGYLSMKPDHRYGVLALLTVDGKDAPQRILATP